MATIKDFINQLGQYVKQLPQQAQHLGQNVEQLVTGTPQDKSPIGDVLSGNFSDIPASINRRSTYFNQHPEAINFSGEMSTPKGSFASGLAKLENGGPEPVLNPAASRSQGAFTKDPNFADKAELPSPVTNAQVVNEPSIPQVTEEMPNPIEPKRTYSSSSNVARNDILENQKRNIVIDGHSIRTPEDVSQVNSTLNGYGIKGSMNNQLQMLNDTKGVLAQRAENIVAREGGETSKSTLLDSITKDLSYNGSKHTIPAMQTKIAANNYIDNVYVRATGGDPLSSIEGATPDKIPDTVIQKMKKIMNDDAGSTFIQPDPTKWTTNQQVARYGRNAFDQILDAKHPEASSLNNDMSDLYNAEDSIRKGANQESALAQKNANTPAEPGFLSNIWTQAKKNPLAAALEVGGLGYGINKVVGPVAGFVNSEFQNLTHNNQQPATDTPQPSSGPAAYKPVNPQDIGLMDEQTYGNLKGQYEAEAQKAQLNDPNSANAFMAKAKQLDATYNSQANVRNELGNFNNVSNLASDAVSTLQTAPASILNSSKGFEDMMKANNGPYAGFAANLQKLSGVIGVDLTTAKSPQALRAAIDKAVATEQSKLKALQTTFSGQSTGSIPSSNLPTVNTPSQSLPQTPPSFNWQQNDPQAQAILNTGHQ